MEILDKLHGLSLVKLTHLEDYIHQSLNQETSNPLKAS